LVVAVELTTEAHHGNSPRESVGRPRATPKFK
jgi:hypothetical protein